MFISKRKWNEMCDRIDKQQNKINELVACHEIKYSPCFDYLRNICLRENGFKHENIKVSTKEISNITLEELARLVIDGTPITRKVIEENVKEYGRME